MKLKHDWQMIDKLVDNELGEPARADVIRMLEATPDGWKRCALGFLEAQTWGQSLRSAARDAADAEGGTDSNPVRRLGPVVRQLFAAAAMVIVAFGAGFASRGTESPRGFVSGTSSGSSATSRVVASFPDGATAPPPAMTPPGDTVPYVPERVRLQLERQGYQVTGDRKLVPIALGDGRKVAVPVDTVSYRYVGRRIQ